MLFTYQNVSFFCYILIHFYRFFFKSISITCRFYENITILSSKTFRSLNQTTRNLFFYLMLNVINVKAYFFNILIIIPNFLQKSSWKSQKNSSKIPQFLPQVSETNEPSSLLLFDNCHIKLIEAESLSLFLLPICLTQASQLQISSPRLQLEWATLFDCLIINFYFTKSISVNSTKVFSICILNWSYFFCIK